MTVLQPLTRLQRFHDRLGTTTCQHCGGRLEFGWDDHEPTAKCWACGREIVANKIPPIKTIEERETFWRLRRDT